ncbi:MAG: hypothetical protein ABSB18_06225 [Candidatus Omnitrophota bacterium]
MRETFIRIAGITVKIKSHQAPKEGEGSLVADEHFVLKEKPRRVDIELDLEVKPRYYKFKQQLFFETRRDPAEIAILNYKEAEGYLGPGLVWRIAKMEEGILIEGNTLVGYQLLVNKQLNKGKVYIINSNNQWDLNCIINGWFLNILIIYYLSKYKVGLMVHSCALDDNGNGYIFAGRSGAGKSTISRIWGKLDSVRVLSDDRVVVRKDKGAYYIYPTPWHQCSTEYFKDMPGRSRLRKLFYITHGKTNFADRVGALKGFHLFYPTLFLPFWDKECLDFTFDLLLEVFSKVPTYAFCFKNNYKVISYIRDLR